MHVRDGMIQMQVAVTINLLNNVIEMLLLLRGKARGTLGQLVQRGVELMGANELFFQRIDDRLRQIRNQQLPNALAHLHQRRTTQKIVRRNPERSGARRIGKLRMHRPAQRLRLGAEKLVPSIRLYLGREVARQHEPAVVAADADDSAHHAAAGVARRVDQIGRAIGFVLGIRVASRQQLIFEILPDRRGKIDDFRLIDFELIDLLPIILDRKDADRCFAEIGDKDLVARAKHRARRGRAEGLDDLLLPDVPDRDEIRRLMRHDDVGPIGRHRERRHRLADGDRLEDHQIARRLRGCRRWSCRQSCRPRRGERCRSGRRRGRGQSNRIGIVVALGANLPAVDIDNHQPPYILRRRSLRQRHRRRR